MVVCQTDLKPPEDLYIGLLDSLSRCQKHLYWR